MKLVICILENTFCSQELFPILSVHRLLLLIQNLKLLKLRHMIQE